MTYGCLRHFAPLLHQPADGLDNAGLRLDARALKLFAVRMADTVARELTMRPPGSSTVVTSPFAPAAGVPMNVTSTGTSKNMAICSK